MRTVSWTILWATASWAETLEDVEFETMLLEKQLTFARLQLEESRLRHERDMRSAAIAATENFFRPPRPITNHAPTMAPHSNGTYLWDGVSKRPKVKIVVWNKIAGYLDWLRDDFTSAARQRCSTECIFTKERGDAQGYVFHAKTHSANDFPKKKTSAPYILVSLEQEKYAPLLRQKRYVEKFDATATFRLDSTIPMITIPPHWDADSYFKRPPDFHKKANAAVAFVSNCRNAGAEDRLRFLQQLIANYDVHSYGRCLHNKDEPPEATKLNRAEKKRNIVAGYKFYLALENNVHATDYVSEKVFDGLLAGSLPIYRGTDSIHNLLPSPDAVINVRSDFNDDPTALAAHLRYLTTNQSAYDDYFTWRRKADPTAFQAILDMTAYKFTALCRICAFVHDRHR